MLAKTAKQRLSWVPAWSRVADQAERPANYISGQGIQHYQKYLEDFDILTELGLTAFRFGIEWARVQPAENTWDQRAIEHYRVYIAELNRRGIEPILTLWHWTMPVWFTDKGGLEKRRNLVYFDRYVQRIAQEFGGDLRYVLTINEPNVYTGFSYATGEWPPQRKNLIKFARVYYNLVLAHRRAYAILKAASPELQVGVAAQLANIQPKRPDNGQSICLCQQLVVS